MIVAAVFCPQPPLLVPAVATGAAPELDGLRSACRGAIGRAGAAHPVVLLGSGPVSASHSARSRGTLAQLGVPGEIHLGDLSRGGALDLPPSLTVGAWLVQDALGPHSGAVAYSVGPEFGRSRAATELLERAETGDLALIVLGDGSARRTLKAPGYLDERAEAFDATVAAALSSGDGARLEALDADLGAQLLAAGVPAWRAAGALLAGGRYDADLLYDQAPYGVGYFLAEWTARG
ncbi:MAG: hypothetical protein ABI301_04440 [Jatrophihabitantaceae bacterium]